MRIRFISSSVLFVKIIGVIAEATIQIDVKSRCPCLPFCPATGVINTRPSCCKIWNAFLTWKSPFLHEIMMCGIKIDSLIFALLFYRR